MAYPGIIITAAGHNAIAEAITNSKSLIFTEVAFGSGDYDGDITKLTALVAEKKRVDVGTITDDGNGQFTITTTLTNDGLEEGFRAKEVGVFGKVGSDGEEVLMAYTNGGNNTAWIDSKDTVMDPHPFNISVVVGNDSDVTVVVSQNALVNQVELQTHDTSDDSHKNILMVTNTADKPASMSDRGLWVEILEE